MESQQAVEIKNSLIDRFVACFQNGEPEVTVRSPGRIEILGNHTDYNNGFALAGAISRHIYVASKRRSDRIIRCFSTAYPSVIHEFSLDAIPRKASGEWADYVKGVCDILLAESIHLGGADLYFHSDLPNSGGISSSASLELGVAKSLVQLYQPDAAVGAQGAQHLARLCQVAENHYVGTPCGFLDQAAVALPQANHMLFIDFQQQADQTYQTQLISAPLGAKSLKFVLAVDPSVKRNLGETGYPARRKMCEQSLVFWSEVLGRQVESLRAVSVEEFEAHEAQLAVRDALMHKRVKHVVHENQRVLLAVQALAVHDFQAFGQLMTASGESAISLYDLADGVPQLSDLVALAPGLPGVLGARNMGGGFSVLLLALLEEAAITDFESQMQRFYQERYPQGQLEFITISLSQGTDVFGG